MEFSIEYIEKLAKVINKHELEEITLEDNDKAIVIKKGSTVVAAPVVQKVEAQAAAPAPIAASEETPAVSEAPKKNRTPITSPMVGCFYPAPSPTSAPFVKVGDKISTGQVVCIIEAMKLMNEIESEVSGTIAEICVEEGQSVEYGQVLMYVE
ncbi:acetyl-CoA carboxylase biotin carboxyl carrier protein [bacterium]|nr:acetyl-CoA carboxylase biotin carboxyl carrier protein [bacterium]